MRDASSGIVTPGCAETIASACAARVPEPLRGPGGRPRRAGALVAFAAGAAAAVSVATLRGRPGPRPLPLGRPGLRPLPLGRPGLRPLPGGRPGPRRAGLAVIVEVGPPTPSKAEAAASRR